MRRYLDVACNWDWDLPDRLREFPVKSLYGKLKADLVGGGRASDRLRDFPKEDVGAYLALCHTNGIRFDYLLNTSTLGNREFDIAFRRKLFSLLEWISSVGCDGVVVAIPFLAATIKKYFPNLSLSVSKMARVTTPQKAKMWEDIGANAICIDTYQTRRFKVLRAIRKAVSCELKLLANDACLLGCPWDDYHNLMESQASRKDEGTPYVSYCTYNCRNVFYKSPAEIIKSMFIRPEDIEQHYMEAGIDIFKLIDRNRPTEWIINCVRAYSEGSYKGNLFDLMGMFSTWGGKIAPAPSHIQFRNLERLTDIQSYRTGPYLRVNIFVDNGAMEGFIDHFKSHDCALTTCEACRHCYRIAEKVVRFDAHQFNIVKANLQKILARLHKIDE